MKPGVPAAIDQQEWIDGLRRKWGLVTVEGLPPDEETAFADAMIREMRRSVLNPDEARAMLGLPPRPEAP